MALLCLCATMKVAYPGNDVRMQAPISPSAHLRATRPTGSAISSVRTAREEWNVHSDNSAGCCLTSSDTPGACGGRRGAGRSNTCANAAAVAVERGSRMCRAGDNVLANQVDDFLSC